MIKLMRSNSNLEELPRYMFFIGEKMKGNKVNIIYFLDR